MTTSYTPQYQNFRALQQQGVARPPQPTITTGELPGGGDEDEERKRQAAAQGPQRNPSEPVQPPGQPQPQQPPPPGGMPYGGPQGDVRPPPSGGYPSMPQGGGWTLPNLGPQLQDQWQNYQGMPQFGGGFQSNFQFNPYQPQGFNGPSPFGSFQGQQQGQGPIGGAMQQQMLSTIQNPSAYGAPQVMGVYNALNNRLSQEFDVQRQQLNEDAARRGMYYSTPAMGRLGDVAVRQAQAQADLAQQLTGQAAQTYGSDRAQALGLGQQYEGQGFGQDLASYGANQGTAAQNFGQQLAGAQFNQGAGQQGFQNQLAAGQFGLGQNAQNFGQAQQAYQTNLGANSQNFQQQQALLGNLLGYGQQGFENALSTAQFNQGQDMSWLQALLASLGAT